MRVGYAMVQEGFLQPHGMLPGHVMRDNDARTVRRMRTDPGTVAAKSRMMLDFWKHYDANTMQGAKVVQADHGGAGDPWIEAARWSRQCARSVGRPTHNVDPLETELDVVKSIREPDKGDDRVLVWAVVRRKDEVRVAHAMKYRHEWGCTGWAR